MIFQLVSVIDGWGISRECQRTLLIVSQDWFRQWLGADKQQAIIWANVNTALCHHMASLGHNELKMMDEK